MKRRLFLALAGGGLAAAAAFASQLNRVERFIVRHRRPRLDRHSPTGRLAEAEMKTILALAEVLIPIPPSDDVNAKIGAHIDQQTTTSNGFLKEYRAAAVLLDTTAMELVGKKPFFELDRPERTSIVAAILPNADTASGRGQRLKSLLLPRDHRAFKAFIVRDILTGFFRKAPAEAWALVGYARYPGIPGDPRAYARISESLRPQTRVTR
jgi:hypothetical protein